MSPGCTGAGPQAAHTALTGGRGRQVTSGQPWAGPAESWPRTSALPRGTLVTGQEQTWRGCEASEQGLVQDLGRDVCVHLKETAQPCRSPSRDSSQEVPQGRREVGHMAASWRLHWLSWDAWTAVSGPHCTEQVRQWCWGFSASECSAWARCALDGAGLGLRLSGHRPLGGETHQQLQTPVRGGAARVTTDLILFQASRRLSLRPPKDSAG